MSLPEPKAGQIWANTYLSGNGVPSKWKVISRSTKWPLVVWDVESIDTPKRPNNMLHSNSVNGPDKSNHIYYVGEGPRAESPDYKPEPAVGQFWISQVGAQIRLIKFNSDKEVFETDVLSNYSGSYLTRSGTFIGWYDTSLLVPEEVVDLKRYPHKCPRCKEAAYIGFNMIDCSAGCKK